MGCYNTYLKFFCDWKIPRRSMIYDLCRDTSLKFAEPVPMWNPFITCDEDIQPEKFPCLAFSYPQVIQAKMDPKAIGGERSWSHFGNLRLDQSSVSNGESNSKGYNTCYKTSSVTNDGGLINLRSLGSKGSHSGGKSGDGSSILVLYFSLDLWHDSGLPECWSVLRGGKRGRACANCSKEESDGLVCLHDGSVLLFKLMVFMIVSCRMHKVSSVPGLKVKFWQWKDIMT